MKRPTGVWEHLQQIKLGFTGVLLGAVERGVLPALVPLELDLALIVGLFGHSFRISSYSIDGDGNRSSSGHSGGGEFASVGPAAASLVLVSGAARAGRAAGDWI